MNAKYNVNNISVGSILSKIEMGEIGIPDIQRPFVWKNTYVRDLIDSLYHGYDIDIISTDYTITVT